MSRVDNFIDYRNDLYISESYDRSPPRNHVGYTSTPIIMHLPHKKQLFKVREADDNANNDNCAI